MGTILDVHKSLGTKGMYSGLLRELANVTARVLVIILGRSWWLGVCWRKENFTPVVRKGKKEEEDLGSYRLVTLSSGTGKITEQILEAVSRHMKNETRNSQCRFALVNHVCPEYLLQWNEMVSHSTIAATLVRYGLDKWVVKWVKCGCIIRLKGWWSVTWSWNSCWVWVVSLKDQYWCQYC